MELRVIDCYIQKNTAQHPTEDWWRLNLTICLYTLPFRHHDCFILGCVLLFQGASTFITHLIFTNRPAGYKEHHLSVKQWEMMILQSQCLVQGHMPVTTRGKRRTQGFFDQRPGFCMHSGEFQNSLFLNPCPSPDAASPKHTHLSLWFRVFGGRIGLEASFLLRIAMDPGESTWPVFWLQLSNLQLISR